MRNGEFFLPFIVQVLLFALPFLIRIEKLAALLLELLSNLFRFRQEMENVQSRLNSLNNKMESNFATQQSISGTRKCNGMM